MPFTLRGPKGGLLIRRANPIRIARALPGLIRRFKKVTVTEATMSYATPRDNIGKWARWGVAHEPEIHYTETSARDDWLTANPRNKLPLSTDCSGFVTLCYYLAGAPDPNGLDYKRLGYTGTLLDHGHPIGLSLVKPGDVVVYGSGAGVHTAVIVEGGADPLTVSHGKEAGPLYERVSQDNRPPVRYLSFLP